MNQIKQLNPYDEHNKILESNVRPPGRLNPEPGRLYDLVVIGAGSAGLVTSAGAAGVGAKVALIEERLVGGDCLNVGCVPSKCLLRSAKVVEEVKRAVEFGVLSGDGPKVDFAAVMERMRRIRSDISRNDSVQRFTEMGVDVFIGKGKFTGEDTVDVDGKSLKFRKAVIATGGSPVAPQIPGLAQTGFLNNESIFSLTELPQKLAVIGAGPIGCEMSQAFVRFGSEVYLLNKAPQILTREDRDAADIVEKAFQRDGVNLVLESAIEKVEASPAGKKIIHIKSPNFTGALEVDEILVSAGRKPNVEGFGLDTVGVKYDARQGVLVNDYLQTSNPRIYAAGDVCLRYKFTHAADASARIVIQNALFPGNKKASGMIMPWCTYTDPEIAHVGMYAHDAQKEGLEFDTFTQPMSEVDRALTDSDPEGFVKIMVKKGTDKILGATIVAHHAGDMIGELCLAMNSGTGLKTISGVIHPYPTQAEAIRKTADAYSKTRLTPLVKKILRWWLSMGW